LDNLKIERQIVTIMRSEQILCRPHKKVYDNLQIKEKRHMAYELTQRCEKLRAEAVDIREMSEKVSPQWAYWTRYGRSLLDQNCQHSNDVICAAGIASVIKNAPAIIGEEELIVGYNFGINEFFESGLDQDGIKDSMRKAGFDEDQIDWYLDDTVPVAKYQHLAIERVLTEKEKQLEAELAITNSDPHRSITANHSVIGYEQIVKYGFAGMLEKVNQYAAANGESSFYEALRMVCEAGCEYGSKYAQEAEKIGREDIAAVCRQVPANGARNFREAVQALWFAHIVNTWEDTINANSVGRLDQILYPYYIKDIEDGVLTKQEAFEIICCLWLKLYRDYDVQQSCVGGRNADGSSAVNELSYMMLEATEKLGFVRCMSVRFDQNTDKNFLLRALEVVGKVQKGIPFFFNDDVMIPALVSAGIPYEDACNYTQIGCVETVIPGKANPHAVNSRTNMLKALEYALANGKSLHNPDWCPGMETGDPAAFTFEELLDALKKQIAYLIRETIDLAVDYMPWSNYGDPKPVKSLLTEGCVEKGLDFNNGGALYDYYQLMLVGIPNLADSLAAIKKFVYDDKRYTLQEVIEQLRNNWEDEVMRTYFQKRAPKFGNDVEWVDQLAFDLTDFACDCIAEESRRVGYSFHAQPFTFLWMIDHGRLCGASADGRRDGEILAYSVSPMQGRDSEGLTALLNSISRMPTKKTPGTTSAIVEVDPLLFNDKYLPYLVDMLYAAGAKGLCNVQFNTVSVDTLIDAQKHPEKHRNLAVRVSGFSQKFNLLSRELQDHIIARTKHAQM